MAHVTFIHGIANKPPCDVLLRSWTTALGDGDGPELDALGVTSSMVYWANFLYREPTAAEAAYETAEAIERAGVEAWMRYRTGSSLSGAAVTASRPAPIRSVGERLRPPRPRGRVCPIPGP
jgi:hypothetical protein